MDTMTAREGLPRSSSIRTVLVTGATGYVGSRLVPGLVEAGFEVAAASRQVDGTRRFPWDQEVETRAFDVEDVDTIRSAVTGVDAVIYLVHSMESEAFVEKDRRAAERVAAACDDAGVKQVVYLSGLVPDGDLSDHLRSRLEVENVLLESPVPTVVLRAAMIVGAGSTSYELLRRLSERVPLLTPVPRWMDNDIQPLAIDDAVAVMVAALRGERRNEHYDVGGDEVYSYPRLLSLFADVRGLRRRQVLVPAVPQGLVGRMCSLIAGMQMTEVTTLVESLRHDMVCDVDSLRRDLLPADFAFTPIAAAIRAALDPTAVDGTRHDGVAASPASTDQS